MNFPGESSPSHKASAGIAEIALGKGHTERDLEGYQREITVHTETPDYTAGSFTAVTVVQGSGLLIFKQPDGGVMCGRRILEPGATANLPTGTRYCYWDTPTDGIDLVVIEDYSSDHPPLSTE